MRSLRLLLVVAAFLAPAAAYGEPLVLRVASAAAGFEPRSNQPIVTITLAPDAQEAMAAFTAANIGRQIEIRIDGRVRMKPIVREAIRGGVLQISGSLTTNEAGEIARTLSSGTARLEIEAVPQ